MTRDRTFLIEHGERAGPVKNSHLTQGILKALSELEMIGRELHLNQRD